MNTENILQQKLTPREIEYLGLLMKSKERFMRIETPLGKLNDTLKYWWPRPLGLVKAARHLRKKIIGLAAKTDTGNRGHVRMAMLTGRAKLITKDSEIPTRYAVLDVKNGLFRHGWLNPDDPASVLMASIGMQIVCQSTNGKTYEDWVGMGAPVEVIPSATDTQRERILIQELAVKRPFTPMANPMLLNEKL